MEGILANMDTKDAGKMGGNTTLKRHGKEKMTEWGKLGGRPKRCTDETHLIPPHEDWKAGFYRHTCFGCGKISHFQVTAKDTKSSLSILSEKDISYTCCNLEVNEKAGSEVHCRGCGEWCETKKAE